MIKYSYLCNSFGSEFYMGKPERNKEDFEDVIKEVNGFLKNSSMKVNDKDYINFGNKIISYFFKCKIDLVIVIICDYTDIGVARDFVYEFNHKMNNFLLKTKNYSKKNK